MYNVSTLSFNIRVNWPFIKMNGKHNITSVI